MPKGTASRRGKGLSKKLGPFPTYVWVLIGGVVIVGYIYYRKRQTTAGSQNQQIIPSGVVVPPTSTSTPSDNTVSSPVNFPTDYATQTDLASAIDQVNNQTAQDIAAITFPQPTINLTVPTGPNNPVATTTAKTKSTAKKVAAATAASKPRRYYTYKRNVPLRAGQTLNFARGKGYYAA
jgi:hypothetical protein